ncbi:hypothetical protein AN957_22925 [Cytobacillus solani]|uniref:Uncharacterized protein n=1 Tax=Cytobacillus solani TaxID=1637975 RepID=A0A0Q3TDB9_9BACI|nr:hypothetical protein AN957_22925 [Cytobacillus solani]
MSIRKNAESADVIKKIPIRKMAKIDKDIDQGNSLKTANKTSSVAYLVKSTFPACCTSMDEVPNTANQKKLTRAGSNNTPIITSRMVLPLDTRAIMK